jgi:hypothetical protein
MMRLRNKVRSFCVRHPGCAVIFWVILCSIAVYYTGKLAIAIPSDQIAIPSDRIAIENDRFTIGNDQLAIANDQIPFVTTSDETCKPQLAEHDALVATITMTATITEDDMLQRGLLLVGFGPRRQEKASNKLNKAWFVSHFGCSPVVCAHIWKDLIADEDEIHHLKRFFIFLHFLKYFPQCVSSDSMHAVSMYCCSV